MRKIKDNQDSAEKEEQKSSTQRIQNKFYNLDRTTSISSLMLSTDLRESIVCCEGINDEKKSSTHSQILVVDLPPQQQLHNDNIQVSLCPESYNFAQN